MIEDTRASRYYSLPSEVEELRPLLIRHPPLVDAVSACPGPQVYEGE